MFLSVYTYESSSRQSLDLESIPVLAVEAFPPLQKGTNNQEAVFSYTFEQEEICWKCDAFEIVS